MDTRRHVNYSCTMTRPVMPTKAQISLLRQLGKADVALQAAAARYHASFAKAVNGGCTTSQLALELDLSRQAVDKYRKRWNL